MMIIFKQLIVAMLLVLALSACGVRGDPEAPPQFVEAH